MDTLGKKVKALDFKAFLARINLKPGSPHVQDKARARFEFGLMPEGRRSVLLPALGIFCPLPARAQQGPCLSTLLYFGMYLQSPL